MLAVLLLNRMGMRKRVTRNRQTVKMVKSEALEIEVPGLEYCRTCLNTEDLVSIFYNKETEDKRSQDLLLVTGLEIKMNDGLSQKICSQCIEIMNSALQFRKTSKKADRTLRNMLAGDTKPKKKTQKLQKIIKSAEKRVKEKVECDVDFAYNQGFNEDGGAYADDFQNEEYQHLPIEVESIPKVKQKTVKKEKENCCSPYKCTTCNKEFRMRATFKAHTRFHTNYCVCEACGKRCRNNNQLQEHKRARHGLSKIHKCTYCEYSSATKEALTIHERRHTGERPYICDHCGTPFHRRSNLVQHMAIHLPDKNFQCNMCPKRLKSFKLLKIHEYKYHRENKYRYLCPVCHDTFSRPGNVRQHLVRSHRIPRDHQGVIERLEINQILDSTAAGVADKKEEVTVEVEPQHTTIFIYNADNLLFPNVINK